MNTVHNPGIFLNCNLNGNQPPFVCLHPIGGGAFCYYHLLKGWDKHFPLIAIQAVYEFIENVKSIQELAEYYVNALRKYYPSDTYFLGGWSFGGILAFEMARILNAANCYVPQLVLYDSYLPVSYRRLNPFASTQYDILRKFSTDILAQYNIKYSDLNLSQYNSKESLFHFFIDHKVFHKSFEFQEFSRLIDVYSLNKMLYETYYPKKFQINVVMFRCISSENLMTNPDYDWKRLLIDGEYIVKHVNVDHYGLFLPQYSKEIALETCEILRKVQINSLVN